MKYILLKLIIILGSYWYRLKKAFKRITHKLNKKTMNDIKEQHQNREVL